MKNRYFPVSLAMYSTYIAHGFGLVILMQTASYLTEKFDTNLLGIAWLTSMMAVGKIAILIFSGVLSDKFGRKPFVLLGIVSYIIFFAGILISPTLQIAAFFALFAGAGNSFLDSGCMPAWMEAYPESPGTVTILQKAFVSAGQFLLPLLIGFFAVKNLYFGYTYFVGIAILLVALVVVINSRFPPMPQKQSTLERETADTASLPSFTSKPKLYIEGICLILIGYTATATFSIHSNWMHIYGQEIAHMSAISARSMLSVYSFASILAVLSTAVIIKSWVKGARFLIIYPTISVLSLLTMYLFPTPTVCYVVAFLIGFTAAGGVLQLAVSTMAELFPMGKGKVTSVVYMACSIALLTVPTLSGLLAQVDIKNVILFNAILTSVGVILAIIVNIRYNMVMKKK